MHSINLVDLLTVLTAGFLAGLVCRWFRVSMLVGYLVVGTLIGDGVLGLISPDREAMHLMAEGGVLLLLFSIGLEFSTEELLRLSKYLVTGGAVQMVLVIVSVTLFSILMGMNWRPALLVGSAVSLSSTVLVFKALAEHGQVETAPGRRAVGILLFQDLALVPLLLLIPMLTGTGESAGVQGYLGLAFSSILFVAAVVLVPEILERTFVPLFAKLRSPELLVLFSILALGSSAWLAFTMGLPASLGAFAAGLILSGNRLSGQVDALILPFRETFSAVFFVSLGLLLDPRVILQEPLLIIPGLFAVVILKTFAAGIALHLTGLSWRTSFGTGLGLAQLGEFSFVLVLAGFQAGILSEADYNRMLCFAMGTLIATPQLLQFGLGWASRGGPLERVTQEISIRPATADAIVIGAGLAGRQVASQLEISGRDVCIVDLSPVNLHHFSQQGFRTVAGDASDPEVVLRAGGRQAGLVVICVPNDPAIGRIVSVVRGLNPQSVIIARCRYSSNTRIARNAGANHVLSDEAEASAGLLHILTRLESHGPHDAPVPVP